MKLNGKNIITDKDITVTEAQNLGDNLSEILQKHQRDLDSLKGNVKWLYKYGGTGSGGGGGTGGGSNSKWDIFATLGGRTLSANGVVSLSKSDNSNYTLSLSIKNGNGYYSITISYDGGKSTTLTLSPDNGWKTNLTLYLPKNEKINIVADDGSDIKQIECDYITNPYEFNNIKLLNNNNIEYQDLSGDVLFEDARTNGLIAVVNYSIAIEADASYKWRFFGEETEFINIESNRGRLEFSIPEEILGNNDNAGMYEITCIIEITPKNQEKEIITYNKVFNLIPETLYLKITPEVGTFYTAVENQLENIYKFKTANTISFLIRAYFGNNLNRPGEVTCILSDINEDGSETELSNQKVIEPITENIEKSIGIYYTTQGWKKLEVRCSMDGAYYSSVRYLFVEEVNTSYKWYKQSAEPTLTTFYRMGNYDNSNKLSSLLSGIHYQISNSSEELKISKDLLNTPVNGGDILISLGIQYNEINNTNNPIITFNNNNNGNDAAYCKIYQDKIIIEDNYTANIFFEKTLISEYNADVPQNYHLIQILFRHTYSVPNQTNQDYKQVCIYIDGVLETALQNWFNYAKLIDNIVIHPGNYSINLLELSYFTNYRTRPLNDIDINYYFDTYRIESRAIDGISEEENAILESLYSYDSLGNASPSYTIENQMIKLNSSGVISTISKNVQVPTLVCKVERYLTSYDSNTSIFDWINLISLTEQDSVTGEGTTDTGLQAFKCPVSLRWYNSSSTNGSGIDFSDTRLMTGASMFGDVNIEFYLRLQGSSTMRFKSKNLTLGVRSTSTDENAPQPVFSPNFLPNDSTTFLPDEAFTLKADVVDSSHSNNTCLGKFINNVYSSAGITAGSPEGSLRNHVKTCLEGFPILLFLEVSDAASGTAARETEYYYLGVYNFNLGRENQLNLGYIPLSTMSGVTSGVPNEYSFYTHLIPKEKYQPIDNLIIAEVQGNSPMWDFSQYDNSVLFKIDSIKGDNNYMFGDIIYGSKQNTSYKNNIANFVRSVSGAGNYIFTSLGKNFLDVIDPSTGGTISHVAYRTENSVPNSDTQYKRNNDGKTYSVIPRNGTADLLPPRTDPTEFTKDLLYSCILETELGDSITLEYLDYKSAVYYYTICMAFGLVDSVQKNLNIKTWNGKTFGLYFYDMDTALGTSNSGGDTSYFCFSDYWKTNITEYRDEEGNPVIDSEGNTVYKNSGVNIYRDYYPEDPSLPSGYDIPSTYLFAVSKYAACFESELSSAEKNITLISPQSLWGDWRKKGGFLESADVFVNNYFKDHLSKVPNILLNLNYRNKYLYTTTGNSEVGFGFNSTDIKNLKGRQIQKVRDWLTSRFHLLDAYFNLGKESVLIYETPDKRRAFYEPFSNLDTLAQNTDIIMLHDIFSPEGTTLNRDGNLEFRIKARNYTPLIHKHANAVDRLLIEDENREYSIKLSYNGNQTSKLGGSEGWTYLDSLNSFIQTLKNGGFHLNTKRLEYVEGTKGKLEGQINLNIPSTKTLKLTSPDYKCDVSIDDSFYNLTNVTIDDSQIRLNITGSKVSEISANNVTSEEITLHSCSSLKKVSITDSKITKFTATPIWEEVKDSLNMSDTTIKNLVLSGRGGNGELIINGSSSLENLTFSNFKEIVITGCPNLKNVTCNDSTNPVITKLFIVGASKLEKVIVLADNLTELDLTGCTSLTNLELRKTNTNIELDKLQTLKLGSTLIKKIKRTYLRGNNWVEDNNINELNLTYYPNLTDLRIDKNTELEYVRVNNIEDNPYQLNYYTDSDNNQVSTFTGCTNLRRIFGHVKISDKNSFSECNKFSIHGYYELIDDNGKKYNSLSSESGEHITYCGVRISNNSGYIYHPLDSEVINNITVPVSDDKRKMKFQEGNNVTNISFSGSLPLCQAFYRTSCTIFDIYYVFQNLNETDENLNCSSCFRELIPEKRPLNIDIHKFNWTSSYDNSPSRNMFKDWGYKLGSLSAVFYSSGNRFRIFSTEYNEDGTVNTPGLFYYTPNISSISTIFHGSTYYTNKNVFKTYTDRYNNLVNISYFNPTLVLSDINTIDYNNLHTVSGTTISINLTGIRDINKIGDFDEFFSHCTSLTSITNVLTSTYLINYDKFRIKIPDTVQNIVYSFVSSYAIGTMNISNMFRTTSSNSTLKSIDQSFRVTSNIATSDLGKILGLETVKFYLNNNIFRKFQGLTSIGYRTSNIDAGSMLDSEYSSFCGYIDKFLENGNFPYEIISHLTKLTTFSGFFRNCNSINPTDNQYPEISLPGTLFSNNRELTNISRCFQDFKGKITLSSNGFENCKKLTNVSYLFCNSIDNLDSLTHDGSTKLGILSSIPNKFFYHGRNSSINKTITGGNDFIDIDISGNDWDINTGLNKASKIEEIFETIDNVSTKVKTVITEFTEIVEFTNSDTVARLSPTSKRITTVINNNGEQESYISEQVGNINDLYGEYVRTETVSNIPNPIKTISNMSCCFQGQGWINYYEHILQEEDIELNDQYQPYRYIKNTTTGIWTDNISTQQTGKYTYMWAFDGDNNILPESIAVQNYTYHLPDENIDLNRYGKYYSPGNRFEYDCTRNFFCAPDLFRYSTTNVNINNIFNTCGYSSQLYLSDEISTTKITNHVKFGMEGRVCPYLLKPIPEITSLIGFLTNAKRLSYYYIEGSENTYLIPKSFLSYTNKIANLSSAFKGMVWPKNCDLQLFNNLTKPLNLDYTFQYSYFMSSSSDRFRIENVFVNKQITSAKATFSIENMPTTLPNTSGCYTEQYIDFGINFTKSKMPTETDTTNLVVKCIYDGYSGKTVKFKGYNSSNNTTEEFKYNGNTQNSTPFNYRVRGEYLGGE